MRPSEKNLVLFLATGAGAGYSPLFPGTVGTLVGVPFSLGLNHLGAGYPVLALVALVGAIFGAIWLSAKAADFLQQTDPAVIVIDEVVGFLVANFLTPSSIGPLISTFFLFRFFDIIKPYPVSRLEKLPSGRGIVLDDVMAGTYTWVIVQMLFWLHLL